MVGVVAVVAERVSDRLWHDGASRKVHHRVEAVLGEQLIEQIRVTGVADDQFSRRHRLRKPGGKVVQSDDSLTRCAELTNHVAADVTGAASHEYGLDCHLSTAS